jgi:flagellar hook-length control protein FliK
MEAQSRSGSAGLDALESAGNAQASDFTSLLDGFAGQTRKESIATLQREVDALRTELGAMALEPGAGGDPLQALLPEMPTNDSVAAMPALQSGNPVLSILENLLPRILTPAAHGDGVDLGQSGASLGSSHLPLLQQEASAPGPGNSGLGSKLEVSVQNQETHFKPIVEGLNHTSTEPGSSVAPEEIGSATVNLPASQAKGSSAWDRISDADSSLTQALSDMAVKAEAAERHKEQETVGNVSSERATDRGELQKQVIASGTKGDAASLPPSTFQHLAESIIEDIKGVSEPQQPSFQQDGLNRIATARASAGVLRVLDLQLRPAELGLVTIRMRLAGDSIEMEIEAQSEDTAELLRNDAEKLSSLLRVSGYRPDVINIQSTDAISHDRSTFQRSQQSPQTQSQSFDQGAAAGQGNPSRHQDGRYSGGGPDLQNDGKEGLPSGGSRSGGIYL